MKEHTENQVDTEQSSAKEAQASSRPLADWEHQAIDAVGNVIDFWGFKRNHGRVWALLYLRGEPLPATEIQDALELSKGAVSMITRELEQWNVIRRERPPKSSCWHFVAETDLMHMISRVVRERESGVILRVKNDLQQAEQAAKHDPHAPTDVLDRVGRMTTLASLIEHAVHIFLNTAHLDLVNLLSVLPYAFPRKDTNEEQTRPDTPATSVLSEQAPSDPPV
ncbi:MAG: transcriptional regulator [Myxococcales bacterium]|nr:transcriptional regulator [Myxococcales bacterium]MCB9644908.1 transcriptional regulator [Myxococcales bacterium]